MNSIPRYVIRTEDQEEAAFDIDEAIAVADDMYDPNGTVPEIVDEVGNSVMDPSEVIGHIIERRSASKRRP